MTNTVFHKPHSTPFTVNNAIHRELEHLEKAGKVKKVTHSDSASPVVVVPREDEQINFCGNYKVTVNESLEVDRHLLPRPNDFLSSFNRKGEVFKDRSHSSVSADGN